MKNHIQQQLQHEKDKQPVKETHPFSSNFASKLGFILLALLVLLLFVFILYEAWVLHSLGGILVLLITIGLLAGLLIEMRHSFMQQPEQPERHEQLLNGLGVIIGALITFELSHTLGLGAVLASAITGLLGGILIPRYGAAIYCGTFVGMCSAEVIFGGQDLLLASIIAGVLFVLARQVLNGLGGKLGTIAFGGALLSGLGFQRQFLIAPVPLLEFAWQIILFSTLSALVTYWLSVSKEWGAVRSSALVGLVGGLLLPRLLPQHGAELAVVVICASFTGMSSAERLSSFIHIFLAGFITGIIFLYSMPVFGGAGGKLGTIAFGASLAIWGYTQISSFFQQMK